MYGKVFSITGGASGIGLAPAKNLLAQGAKISTADISHDGLSTASSHLKSEKWLRRNADTFGRLDGAANVAGSLGKSNTYDSRVVNQDDADWDHIISINLTGTMYCMKEQLKHLGRGGSIVNVASFFALQGLPKFAAYSAAKYGLLGLTRSVAKEMGPEGIRANVVAPSFIDTPMLRDLGAEADVVQGVSRTPIPRLSNPEEVAIVIVFLLGEGSSFVTGSVYTIDGGFTA